MTQQPPQPPGEGPTVGLLDDELPESAVAPQNSSALPPIAYPDGSVSPSMGGAGAVPFDPLGYQEVQALEEVAAIPTEKAKIEALKRKRNLIPKFTTLEAMYAEHPRLMSLGRLRVERLEPKFFADGMGQRVPVSGIIAMSAPTMSTPEFVRQFGGYRFRVYGTLEQSNAEFDGGPPQPTDVAVAEFHLPVAPNMQNLPIAEASLTMSYGFGGPPYAGGGAGFSGYGPQYPQSSFQQQGWDPTGGGWGGGGPNLDSVFSFASNVMDRGQQPMQQFPSQAWDAFSNMHQTGQNAVTQMAGQQMQILQHQLDEERRRGSEERQWNMQQAQVAANRPSEFREAIEGMAALRAAEKSGTDTDVMRQIRDDHERAMRFTREEADRRITAKDQEAHRWVEQVRSDSERQIQAAETRLRGVEETLRAREAEFRRELENRDTRYQSDLQMRITEKDREFERRFADLQASHDREMRMLSQMQEHSSRTTESAHNIEMRSLQNDMAKMVGELEEKAGRLSEHEAKANRPLLEQVAELKQVSEQLSEMGGGDGGDSPESKWYESPLVAGIAQVAMEKGADLLPKLTTLAAGAGQAAQSPATPPPQAGRPAMAGRPQPGALPPRQKYRMVFDDSEGPPIAPPVRRAPLPQHRLGDEPDASTNSHVTGPRQFTLPDDVPQRRQPQMQPQMQPQPQAGPPMPQPAQPVPTAPPMPQQPQQPVPTAPPTAQQPPQAAQGEDLSAFAKFGVDTSFIKGALIQLETYMQQGTSPEAVAQEFAQAFPAATLSQIPQNLPLGEFVDTIRTCPATQGLKLATGSGKRFLYRLWKALEQMGAAAAEPAAPAPAPAPAPAEPPSPAAPPVPAEPPSPVPAETPDGDPNPVFADEGEEE